MLGTWVKAFAGATVCAAFVGACGGSDDSEKESGDLPVTGEPVPLSALGDAYEAVLCMYLMQCGGAGYATVDECKADREPTGLGDVEAAVSEGRIEYDANAVGACRVVLEEHICELPYLFVPTVPEILDGCLENPGRQASGAPCRDNIECAAGLYCSMQDYACPGVCRELLREGEACTIGSELECGPALDIDVTLTELYSLSPEDVEALVAEYEGIALECVNDRCEAAIAIGEPCGLDSSCQSGGYCDDSGICQPAATEGEACSVVQDGCASGLFCFAPDPSAPGTCRPLSDDGGPCTFNGDCKDDLICVQAATGSIGECSGPRASGEQCNANADCADGLGCITAACAELPVQGEPCAADACAAGFVCLSSTCVTQAHPGEPCNDTDAICLGRCLDGACALRAALGESCAADDECASRACIGGTCVDDDLCEFRTGTM